jgi:hypothetical protein
MLLTYSIESFVEDIKNGVKIHSMRADPKNRWKAGMTIQHWKDNPRNVKNNPYHFKNDVCVSVQKVTMVYIDNPIYPHSVIVSIDLNSLSWKEIEELMKNDGFKSEYDFINFFFKESEKWEGNLIHWTDKKY